MISEPNRLRLPTPLGPLAGPAPENPQEAAAAAGAVHKPEGDEITPREALTTLASEFAAPTNPSAKKRSPPISGASTPFAPCTNSRAKPGAAKLLWIYRQQQRPDQHEIPPPLTILPACVSSAASAGPCSPPPSRDQPQPMPLESDSATPLAAFAARSDPPPPLELFRRVSPLSREASRIFQTITCPHFSKTPAGCEMLTVVLHNSALLRWNSGDSSPQPASGGSAGSNAAAGAKRPREPQEGDDARAVRAAAGTNSPINSPIFNPI